jgi:antitoxin component YwqK of YwqJK toxin-antitoxin module
MKLINRIILSIIFAVLFFLNAVNAQGPKVFTEIVNDAIGNKVMAIYVYDCLKGQQIGNSSVFVYDPRGKLIKTFEKDANGSVQGCFLEYYSNGMIKSKSTYMDGFRVGAYTEYYSNGKLKVHGMFREFLSDQEKRDLCKEYSKENLETGEIETGIQCADGVKVSFWYFFDEQGNFDRLYEY